MKLALSMAMLVLPILLASCMAGCASSPQLAINSMISSAMPAHDYAYRGPYQFTSGVGASK